MTQRDNPTGSRPRKAVKDQPFVSGETTVTSQAPPMASDLSSSSSTQSTITSLTHEAKSLLNQQVEKGVGLLGQVGRSVKTAARALDDSAPQLAGFAHGLSDKVHGYARALEGQTVDQMVRGASGLTRRQPALVFGLTALAGFLVIRTFKSTGHSGISASSDIKHRPNNFVRNVKQDSYYRPVPENGDQVSSAINKDASDV